jgi:toxin ParE1/3/4
MRLVWTEPALLDLLDLRTYLANDNPVAAARQVAYVLATVKRLSDFPEIGRPGRREGTRELVVGRTPYIVPYRIVPDRIDVLRVLHGRRRWPERL